MSDERDDGRRAPARQRARASAHRAEALLMGPYADTAEAALAARAAICHALLAIYWELQRQSPPATPDRPAKTAFVRTPRRQRLWASEPGA